jgi:hypothetical protein
VLDGKDSTSEGAASIHPSRTGMMRAVDQALLGAHTLWPPIRPAVTRRSPLARFARWPGVPGLATKSLPWPSWSQG